ncbi:hypothetical protein BDR04DRAFT_1119493 [Suillus decipiens]|nr:hypothetical protein BDR04DRAFT_1119493 [Suillus decipiens]
MWVVGMLGIIASNLQVQDTTLGSNVQATCDLTQIDSPADRTWCFAARSQRRLQPSDMLLRDSSNLLQSVMDSPRIALNGNKWNWRLRGLKACQMVDFCVQTTPNSMILTGWAIGYSVDMQHFQTLHTSALYTSREPP